MWKLEIPYPIGINKRIKYQFGNRRFTEAGKAYTKSREIFKWDVKFLFVDSKLPKWDKKMLHVTLELICPDKRHRDVDGVVKEILDALQDAGCYENDYQVKKLTIERKDEVIKNGKVIITIQDY